MQVLQTAECSKITSKHPWGKYTIEYIASTNSFGKFKIAEWGWALDRYSDPLDK